MANLSADERESHSGGDDGIEMPDLNDKPTYLLEHLATFTVNKESGILYPADGMRRLLQLEKTTGIWSQKMQICLDYQWVLIMDYETGNIIERFPASLIQEPTAFTSTDAMELYNNILVFIVSGGNGARSEMHIFQSQNVSAVHLVEDLKQLRNGKVVTKQREPQIYQGNQMSAGLRVHQQQQHHSNQQINLQHQHSSHNQRSANNSLMDHYSDFIHKSGNNAAIESESELGGGGAFNDETSSTSSDKYERDVTVLNHCFDDIEKFIARLQHAAAATRELERRRRNRKSKKRDPGEGLLTLRTRPPHEKEFIDIFAKFKLSFNLLAKLKAHIHDPNAPELVHFLFTPLALIVEAASDTYYDAQIPVHVVNPLLTREAINLLINCVTSKETELWRSLGEAWTVPRDQWKDEIGSYHPVFLDGWSPDYLVVDEPEQMPVTPVPNPKRQIVEAVTVHHQQNADFNGGNIPNADFSTRSEISIDSIERSGLGAGAVGGAVSSGAMMQSLTSGLQNLHTSTRHVNSENNNFRSKPGAPNDEQALEAWLDELQSVGAKIVVVTYPRTANNDKELSVVRGEYLEVLDDTRKWWKARNLRGQIAHVPHTIVAPYNFGENSPNSSQFYGQQQHAPKESVEPRSLDTTDWIRKKHLGVGIEEKRQAIYHEYAVPMRVTFGTTKSTAAPTKVESNQIKEAAPQLQNPKRNNNSITDTSFSMQDELRHVLHMRIRATPSVFIDQNASPAEVENWLIAKKFSPLVLQTLLGISGEELFHLTPQNIEERFGIEGRRLNLQIKLQRNVSGSNGHPCVVQAVDDSGYHGGKLALKYVRNIGHGVFSTSSSSSIYLIK